MVRKQNLTEKRKRISPVKVVEVFAVLLLGVMATLVIAPKIKLKNNDKKAEEFIESLADSMNTVQTTTDATSNEPRNFGPNEDTVGWLKINGTRIDTPVVQTTNNDFYLNYNYNKEKSLYGAVFMDYRFNSDMSGATTVLYGHSGENDTQGRAFTDLKNFENIEFLKSHYEIEYSGLQDFKYVVVAVFWTNAQAADDNGYVFNYTYPDMCNVESFFDECQKRSFITSNIDIDSANDAFLILSTCTRGMDRKEGGKKVKVDARLVIVAKQVEQGEEITPIYTESTTPKMPQVYYTTKGVDNPYASDAKWYPTKKAA